MNKEAKNHFISSQAARELFATHCHQPVLWGRVQNGIGNKRASRALLSFTHLSWYTAPVQSHSRFQRRGKGAERTESLSTSQQAAVLHVCLLGSNHIFSGVNYSERHSLLPVVIKWKTLCGDNNHHSYLQLAFKDYQLDNNRVLIRRFLEAHHFRLKGNKSGQLMQLEKNHIFSRLSNPLPGLKVLYIILPHLGKP